MGDAATYRELGEAAWTWTLRQVREDDGPWLPVTVPEDGAATEPPGDRDSLYDGIAGLAPVLAEVAQSRALSADEQRLADGIVERLAARAGVRAEASLYDGLAGDLTALRLLEPGTEAPATRRLHELATADGWPSTRDLVTPGAVVNDVIGGSAGIVLAALWAGGPDAPAVATAGGEALLRAADTTRAGLDWAMTEGYSTRMPNFSHGTAGVAAALAVAGADLGRPDFVAAAVDGAGHLLDIGSLDDGGFAVPHSLPVSSWYAEPVTYTWCHGPTGTSLLFAALARAGVDQVDGHDVDGLRARCLHSVVTSGLPHRLRPGFWDNDGRCCGTAGVGDVLLDAAQDSGDRERSADLLASAVVMGDALVERALVDADGARWRFVEHRAEPPLLPPGTGWMQGSAGIAAFLLRLARVLEQGLTAAVVDRPDQWWAVPPALRATQARAGRPS